MGNVTIFRQIMKVIEDAGEDKVERIVESEVGGLPLLHLNCILDQIEMAKELIGLGVNVNAKDAADKQTALHVAAGLNNEEFVELLIKSGADISIKDNEGKTPGQMTSNPDILKFFKYRTKTTA